MNYHTPFIVSFFRALATILLLTGAISLVAAPPSAFTQWAACLFLYFAASMIEHQSCILQKLEAADKALQPPETPPRTHPPPAQVIAPKKRGGTRTPPHKTGGTMRSRDLFRRSRHCGARGTQSRAARELREWLTKKAPSLTARGFFAGGGQRTAPRWPCARGPRICCAACPPCPRAPATRPRCRHPW